MLKVVEEQDAREASEELLLLLDEIAREGARRMLIEALRAEADDYVERHRGERDEHGRALVVHNGRVQPRKLTLGAGTVELKAPRVLASSPCFMIIALGVCVRVLRSLGNGALERLEVVRRCFHKVALAANKSERCDVAGTHACPI